VAVSARIVRHIVHTHGYRDVKAKQLKIRTWAADVAKDETRQPMNTLSVLMPVFNEERTLRTIVKRVLDSPVDLAIELVCVDDGSSDRSLEILRELADGDPRVKVIAHPKNLGKGRAVRSAISVMTGSIAIVQDSDLEYDPLEYPRLVAPIVDGRADAVFGSRFAHSEVRRVLFFWHSLGNKFLTMLSNMANDLNLTDMETCYKAIRADSLQRLRLTSDRFGFEPEITARLAQSGARIYEVPISYHGRTYAEGKSIGWRDGMEALWLIFKFRFIDKKFSTDPAHSTLESLSASPGVARWTIDQFRADLGDRVFEAGCGIGNLTSQLIDRDHLHVVDLDESHLEVVRRRLGHLENVTIDHGDLEDGEFYSRLAEGFDSVLCVNVLEHLDHPDRAVEGFYRATVPGGKALILVPAHGWLFSEADVALGHRRRYTTKGLRLMLEDAGYVVETCREFNRLGVYGWLLNKFLGRTEVGPWQAKLFGWVLPLARMIERLAILPGLSVVAIARKD
jgi:SAM-dependent methyltransferase